MILDKSGVSCTYVSRIRHEGVEHVKTMKEYDSGGYGIATETHVLAHVYYQLGAFSSVSALGVVVDAISNGRRALEGFFVVILTGHFGNQFPIRLEVEKKEIVQMASRKALLYLAFSGRSDRKKE